MGLTHHCIGIVEDIFAVEPIAGPDVVPDLDLLDTNALASKHTAEITTTTASIEEYGTESEAAAAASGGRRGSRPVQHHYQLVCTQNILVGPTVLSTTRRTYRFETSGHDDAGGDEIHATTATINEEEEER